MRLLKILLFCLVLFCFPVSKLHLMTDYLCDIYFKTTHPRSTGAVKEKRRRWKRKRMDVNSITLTPLKEKRRKFIAIMTVVKVWKQQSRKKRQA